MWVYGYDYRRFCFSRGANTRFDGSAIGPGEFEIHPWPPIDTKWLVAERALLLLRIDGEEISKVLYNVHDRSQMTLYVYVKFTILRNTKASRVQRLFNYYVLITFRLKNSWKRVLEFE